IRARNQLHRSRRLSSAASWIEASASTARKLLTTRKSYEITGARLKRRGGRSDFTTRLDAPAAPPQASRVPRRPTRSQSIHFVSLGCPKNRVDTEVMLGVSDQAGYRLAAD